MSNQLVATVTIDADAPYRVLLQDTGNGALEQGGYKIYYYLSYNAASPIALTTAPQVVNQNPSINLPTITDTISISITSQTGLIAAGNYTDQVTITVESL